MSFCTISARRVSLIDGCERDDVLIWVDHDTAIKEFKTLVADLEETGFDVEVRAGYEQSLLVFAKAPRELLGNHVYKSRQVNPMTPTGLY